MKKSFLLFSAISLLMACSENQTPQQTVNVDTANIDTKNVAKANNSSIDASKQIIASFYPLAFITQQIVGDKAQVINMAGSIDVHAYELSPQDLVKLNKANLVVFQGAELEPWTDTVIPELNEKGITTLEVTHDLELSKLEEHHEQHKEHEEEHEEKHASTEEKHHEKEEGHDEHQHGEYDPHTWLDPVLSQQMVDEILKALVIVDSANEATYRANAKVLIERYAQLDQDYQTGLANCSNEEVVISHDAYSYLARRYGFKFHAIAGISPQDEPSAKILAELKDEAEEGITHLLIEENKVRRFADTLVRETGLKTLPVNPLGRGTLDPEKDFFDVMNDNLNSFKVALNCQ